MDLLLKTLSQAPLVALFAYMWWNTRKELIKENDRLIKVINQKDKDIKEFSNVIGKLTLTLELIKDRLR